MESLNFKDIPGAEEKLEDFLDNLMNPNQDVFARTQRTFKKFKQVVEALPEKENTNADV